MLPAGLVKATSAATTPLYYMAWCDAFVAVDFESITLPLLFSPEEVYKGYYTTMRKLHSRKASEWERMNVHYTRARKCFKNGQFVECVTALQHACLLRRDVFVADDYQVGAAYEHAAWAAVHLALIRIGGTDGQASKDSDTAKELNGETHEGDDEDDESALSEEDSDGNRRPRKNLDVHNPNEVHKLFSIAEQLLKTCAAKKRSLLPRGGGGQLGATNHIPKGTLNLTTTMGGGVLKTADASSRSASPYHVGGASSAAGTGAITTFPNRPLLEFVLFHNCSNYWVRRRKWRAARKYTALAEARFRALVHKGVVRADDVVPALVSGPSAMECFLRCRSELVRLRSQFIAGNALGGGESLLFQKPTMNHPLPTPTKVGGAATATGSGTFSPQGTIGGESYLSGHSLGLGSGAGTVADRHAGQISLAIANCLPLTHEPLINPKLLPSAVSGDIAAVSSEMELKARVGLPAASSLREGSIDSIDNDGHIDGASPPTAESLLVDGVNRWLHTDKNPTTDGVLSCAVSTYSYLNQFPADVPLGAILPYLLRDPTFRQISMERSLYEGQMIGEQSRQAAEQAAFDENNKEGPAPNKTANMASLQRYRDAISTCDRALDARAAVVAQRAVTSDGVLRLQVWCSPSSAAPPPIRAGSSPMPSVAPTPTAGGASSPAAPPSTANTVAGADQAKDDKHYGDGVWCDVAVSFVVAKREYSAPHHWQAKDHVIPFLYHYTAAVFAFNERKFSLALGHLDRCARIVMATATEAAPVAKMQAERRRALAVPSENRAANPELDTTVAASQLANTLEVNPFWWEKGVVTLRHHCLEGPSQDYYSRYNSTKKAIRNPVELLRKQIMTEHVAAEQARKKRLLHEQVLRNRMLKEEGGDEEVVDAIDQTTGRPSWAIEPSPAETTSIVSELAEYSDNLKQWRDRRGLPASTMHYQPHPTTSSSTPQSILGSPMAVASSGAMGSPSNTAPIPMTNDNDSARPMGGSRALSNPSSQPSANLMKLTYAQKQAQRTGGSPSIISDARGPSNTRATTGATAVPVGGSAPTASSTAPSGSLVRSLTPKQLQQQQSKRHPLPMLRDLAGDVLVASQLRRQLHRKQRGASAGKNNTTNTSAAVPSLTPLALAHPTAVSSTQDISPSRPPIPTASNDNDLASGEQVNGDAIDNTAEGGTVSTHEKNNEESHPTNIFVSVHNALVDALVARQEAQLKKEADEYAKHNPATTNIANKDMPAPSSAAFESSEFKDIPSEAAEGSSQRGQQPPIGRRQSLFDVEGSFNEKRKSVLLPNSSAAVAAVPKVTSPSTALHSQTLLSLYKGSGGNNAEAGSSPSALPPIDRTPLKIAVGVATEEEMLSATSFGVSAARNATTPFGKVKASALLPSPLLSSSPSPRTAHSYGGSGSPIVTTIPIVSRSPILTPKPQLASPPSDTNNISTNSTSKGKLGIPLSASPVGGQSMTTPRGLAQSSGTQSGQFHIDAEKGAVVGSKRFNLVPHLDGIPEKQQALRAMLPSVDFKSQRDLYRTIVAELAENEEILRLRRVELQQRILKHEADKLKHLASQQHRADGIEA